MYTLYKVLRKKKAPPKWCHHKWNQLQIFIFLTVQQSDHPAACQCFHISNGSTFQFIKKWIAGAKMVPTDSSENWESYQALPDLCMALSLIQYAQLWFSSWAVGSAENTKVTWLVMWGGIYEFSTCQEAELQLYSGYSRSGITTTQTYK